MKPAREKFDQEGLFCITPVEEALENVNKNMMAETVPAPE